MGNTKPTGDEYDVCDNSGKTSVQRSQTFPAAGILVREKLLRSHISKGFHIRVRFASHLSILLRKEGLLIQEFVVYRLAFT